MIRVTRYVVFDVETSNRMNDRMSAIGITSAKFDTSYFEKTM